MKLYYSPGACSLSPHIALHEAGLAFEAIAAPTKTHQLPDGTDFHTINPLLDRQTQLASQQVELAREALRIAQDDGFRSDLCHALLRHQTVSTPISR